MKFYYVYKTLAHPGSDGYVQPVTLDERLMHIKEAKKKLGTRFLWICDSMNNALKHALGDRPNSEFLIDPDGKILVARQWSNPEQLRKDLEKHVGPVLKPTRVEDLNMITAATPEKAVTGVVEPIKLPNNMSALKVETILSEGEPAYAKLRAEISGNQLYLGFALDPLYQVHWNNQMAPEFSVSAPERVVISPGSGTGPPVEVPGDKDPREFLLKISARPGDSFEVTFRYLLCDDAETFCTPVTQVFKVTIERDRDAGTRRKGGSSIRPRKRERTGNRPNRNAIPELSTGGRQGANRK